MKSTVSLLDGFVLGVAVCVLINFNSLLDGENPAVEQKLMAVQLAAGAVGIVTANILQRFLDFIFKR